MNPISIIIPTLATNIAHDTAHLALLHAGCKADIVISNGPRRGFTRTANDGIKRADKAADIMLLNDDVFWFPHGWLDTLRRALYSNDHYGIVCPGGHSSTAPMRDGRLGMRGLQAVDQIPFWCALIKRELINRIGLLDPDFIHYASDNWYCETARRKGWTLIWCRDVFLGHKQHGSGMIEKWRLVDIETFARKTQGTRR